MEIVIHDGYDTIGGNKISICCKEGCFLFDFGLNFSNWGRYFEEFINPRTGKVIYDLLKLNLLPKIPIYRKDLAPDGLVYDGKYKFIFYSHAHADHMGLAGLLSGEIPMVLTKETLAIALVDSNLGSPNVWKRITDKIRIPCNKDEIRYDVMCSPGRSKSAAPLIRRITQKDFSDEHFEYVDQKDLWDEIRVFPVYHSLLGASAIGVKVEDFWIVYTGDLKLRPQEDERDWKILYGENRMGISKRTEEFLKEASSLHPMILIVEGTTVTRKEYKKSSEMDVFENSFKVVKNTEKLVLVDFPRRHLERLFTFLKVAEESGRKFVLMPKDYAYLIEIEKIEPAWKLGKEKENLLVYHPANTSFTGKEKEVILKAKEEGILIDYREIEKEPQKFILSSGYWYVTTLLDFNESVLNESVYIHSTSEAYTEEQQIDAVRFGNWLKRFNIKTYGIEFKGAKPEFTGDFHASGHAYPEDLEYIINTLNPEVIIPVHTLDKNWFVSRWGEKVKVDAVVRI